jgi:hypothetical protein
VFKKSKVKQITHYAGEEFSEKKGQVMTVSFELDGQEFTALNGGPQFKFTEAVSFVINCETQEEIDSAAAGLGETHRGRREGSGMRMGRRQVRALLASNTSKVFHRMGEGSGRAATSDARGVADEEARSREATEGICRKVTCSISTLNAASAAKYQMFRCDPVPYPDLRFQRFSFRVSAFPLSPIRQWFR